MSDTKAARFSAIRGLVRARYWWFLAGGAAIWFLNPAAGTVLLFAILLLASGEGGPSRGARLAVYALASTYIGLLAYTQTSTGLVPRDIIRYYGLYSVLASAPVIDLKKELLSGAVPVFNAIQILLARPLHFPPQSLSFVCVGGTMLFFSLGFSRLARRTSARPADEILLLIASFLFAFNLSQTGELLKQFLANSLFFYSFALLSDGNPFFLVTMLASLGCHNSAFMFLPLLPLARVKSLERGRITMAIAMCLAIAVAILGPFEIVSSIAKQIPGLQFLAAKASVYASLTWADTPKRNILFLSLFLSLSLLIWWAKRDEKRTAIAPVLALCLGYCILAIAGIRCSVLAERIIGSGSAIYAAFLLLSLSCMSKPAGRIALWIELSFLVISTILLYTSALSEYGHYSFDLMGGDWKTLVSSSFADMLRYRTIW